MNQRELVWVRFPFSNLTDSKVRPAVVVSNTIYNRAHLDIIVCALTSNLEKQDYSIPISNENLSSGTLPIKSRIRADNILLIEKTLVVRPFARLDTQTFDALASEIAKLIRRA